jgi:TRAP transporter 4TM/12TM fusion protein
MTLRNRILLALALGAAAFHLWAAGVSPFTALVQRPVHLLFMALLGFLGLRIATDVDPSDVAATESGHAWRGRAAAIATAFLVAGAIFSCGYIILENEALVRRAGAATSLDLFAGATAIVVVLALARKTTGTGLVAVAGLALAYALAGPWLPGVLAHRGYSPRRLIEHLYLTAEGIWGIPLGVSADFVYLFVLFGAILEVAGGGTLLIALASRIAGRTRGAPAMTAAVASAFMGSISGSAVANVVTTGSFTIPLMKRAGFRPYFAGAIEAAASTGGQMMPPVMGAGAFILATWTGIPYVEVALAALVPAILFYVALIAAIRFRAEKVRLPAGDTLLREPVLRRIHLLAPLVIIVVLLSLGRSPMRAAFWGVATGLLAAMLAPATRLGAGAFTAAVRSAAASSVQVAAACATAGIVVGVASLTGIGLRMSELIVTLSGGHLLIALLLTALGSIVLGMGLPTTAAYVVLAALGAPALVQLGVPLLAAHLFIFYFGCMSNVTPPVALAAYAASGIAGSPPMRTAVTAMSLAASGFLVPFMFVYGPPLLLQGSFFLVAGSIITAMIGVTGLAAAIIGYGRAPLNAWQRGLVAIAACALIFPGWTTDVFGFVVLGWLLLRTSPAVLTEPPIDPEVVNP